MELGLQQRKEKIGHHSRTHNNLWEHIKWLFVFFPLPLEAYVDFICFLVTVVDHIYINVIELNGRMVRAVIGMVVRAFKRRWSKLKCWEIIIL